MTTSFLKMTLGFVLIVAIGVLGIYLINKVSTKDTANIDDTSFIV